MPDGRSLAFTATSEAPGGPVNGRRGPQAAPEQMASTANSVTLAGTRRRRSEKDASTPLEQLVQATLNAVADLLGQLEHDSRLSLQLRAIRSRVDRLAKRDQPLGWKRHQAEWTEKRKGGRDRQRRKAEETRDRLGIVNDRVDLLRAHDCNGDNRRS